MNLVCSIISSFYIWVIGAPEIQQPRKGDITDYYRSTPARSPAVTSTSGGFLIWHCGQSKALQPGSLLPGKVNFDRKQVFAIVIHLKLSITVPLLESPWDLTTLLLLLWDATQKSDVILYCYTDHIFPFLLFAAPANVLLSICKLQPTSRGLVLLYPLLFPWLLWLKQL